MQPMTPKEIEQLLGIFYDIPQKIDEELATIRHCQEQRNKISLPSVNLSGLPGGKGAYVDRTAETALSNPCEYFDREIGDCRHRIAELQEKKSWCAAALDHLSRADRKIIELAYMGPEDAEARKKWTRPPTWKEIAVEIGYSESRTFERARAAKQKLADLSAQTALPLSKSRSFSE